MNKYKVGDIKFGFKYNYAKYFNDNIEKYLINNDLSVNHNINVILTSNIKKPEGVLLGSNNPYRIITKENNYLLTTSKNRVWMLTKFNNKNKNIEIRIDNKHFKNPANAEYIFTSMAFLELAKTYNYFPLHATSIKVGNDVFLFSAPSGTGKSTHRKYWQDLFSDCQILNDDKPLIKIAKDIEVIGTPFAGEELLNTNTSGKLKAIIFLEQASKNEVVELTNDEKIKKLIKNTTTPVTSKSWDETLTLITKLIDKTKIITLRASNDISAAKYVYNYLYKEEI